VPPGLTGISLTATITLTAAASSSEELWRSAPKKRGRLQI